MSAAEREAGWLKLRAAGLVEGELPLQGAHASAWYVRAMLGIAGWIGAIFLLGFVALGVVAIVNNATAALATGVVMCVAAYAIFRFARENVLATQFALAMSLAGQALFIFGISQDLKNTGTEFAITILLVEAGLALAIPNFIHRVMTTFAATLALMYLMGKYGAWSFTPVVPVAGIAIIWLHESLWARRASLWEPIGYGLALTLLLGAAFIWADPRGLPLMPNLASAPALYAPWLPRFVVGALLVWAVVHLLQRQGTDLASRSGAFALGLATAIAAISLLAPGVSSALVLLLVGFAAGNRVLLAVGFILFAAFISNYYYRLDSTLLVKSMVLIGLGAGILGARAAIDRVLGPQAGEGGDA